MFSSRMIRRWIGRRSFTQNRFQARSTIRRSPMSVVELEDRRVPATITVTTGNDTISAVDTVTSLREAIQAFNGGADFGDVVAVGTYGDNDTVVFSGAFTKIDLNQTLGNILIDGKSSAGLTIQGPGSANLAINGAPAKATNNRIFNINVANGNPLITISGVKLANGNLSTLGANGGAILLSDDPLELNDVVFDNNKTESLGGAISTTTGKAVTVTINNCVFSNNQTSSTTGGGAIHGIASLTLNVANSSFVNNASTSTGSATGGAINNSGVSTITIDNSTFTNNSTAGTGDGGAIRTSSSGTQLIIRDSTFTGNSANGGGALSMAGGASSNVTIERSLFTGNTARTTGGGAIDASTAASFAVRDTSIVNNTSATGGGGIRVSTTPLFLSNSTVSGNTSNGTTATTGGGGILVSTTTTPNLTIENSTITNNRTANAVTVGGGIFVNSGAGTVTLNSTIVAGNFNPNSRDFGAASSRTVAGSNNLFGAIDTGSITLSGSANQKGTEAAPLNPGLFLLGNYGGSPRALVHALQYTSPAIDTGSNLSGLTLDQRGPGFARPLSPGQIDIGAVEGIANLPFPVSNTIANVTTGGAATYTFTVTYDAKDGINTGSLGVNDVTVTGPFATGAITYAGFTTNGNKVTATYQFSPPGMSWDVADNGTYTISLNDGAVTDTNAFGVQGQTLGNVTVAVPNTYVVNDLGDFDDMSNNATMTLREAIRLSNTTNPGVADVISFGSLTGTISMSLGEFSIIDPVVIQGPGAGLLTINANEASRIFNFNIAAAKTESSISGLTMTKGKITSGNGGAILMTDDNLTLSNVVLTENRSAALGGAIGLTTATLRIFDSTMSNNIGGSSGGSVGTNNSGSVVEITRSTISGNSASNSGGGLYVSVGQLTVIDSTISNNSSSTSSGSIGGGALRVSTGGRSTFINSTITGNSVPLGAGGAFIVTGGGTLNIINSTITKNSAGQGSGGIFMTNTGPVINITSSIVAQNSHDTHPDLASTSTTPTVTINNSLIGLDSGGIPTPILGSNNIIGTGMPINAKLGPLGFFGGPTMTHGLLPGSPAVGGGSNTLNLDYDQRGVGFPRVVNATPDMGAFEGELQIPIAFPMLANVVVSTAMQYQAVVTYTDETGIDLSSLGTDNVTLSGPGFVGEVSPTSFMPVGSGKSVTVTYFFDTPIGGWTPDQNGTYTLSIVADMVMDTDMPVTNSALPGPIGSFKVAIPRTYVVNQLGDVNDNLPNNGVTTLREAVELANAAPTSVGVVDIITFDPGLNGSPIIVSNGELAISETVVIQGNGPTNTIINGNGTNRIFNFSITGHGDETKISGVTLTNGRAGSANGGAILLNDDDLTLTNVVISGSFATTSGGAISMTSAVLTIIDSRIIDNFATTTGGAIGATTGTIEVVRTTISGNMATTNGGGVDLSSGTLNVRYSTFSNNAANGTGSGNGGGGINFSTGTVTIINSTISGNSTPNGNAVGGGIRVTSSGTLDVFNSTIANNFAAGAGGGGIAWTGSSTTTLATINLKSTIVGNNVNLTHPDLYQSTSSVMLIVSADNTLVSFDTGKVGISGSNNIVNFDPNLAPLGNYGGPTQTQPLLPNSLALDAGSNVLNLTFDQRGTGFPRQNLPSDPADIGAVEGVLLSPTATAMLTNVTMTGATYEATVVFTDETGINVGSIGLDDVLLSGPGFAMPVSPSSFMVLGSGLMVTAKYTFNAPGGGWTNANNGIYTLTMVADKVFDEDMPIPHPALPGKLGTFQVGIPTTYVVNQIGDVDDGDAKNGMTTLREAINLANASFNTTDTITFAGSIDGQTIVLGSELKIQEPVVIQGNGSPLTKISGNDSVRVFNFAIAGAGAESKISGVTIMKGRVSGGSGAAILLNDDALTLTNVVIDSNEATGQGGAIQLTGAKLVINNSAISNSKTSGSTGGGIGTSTSTASIEINNSTISGNSAGTNGGGIYMAGGTLTISDSTVTANNALTSSAVEGGGGINVTTAKVTITGSVISNNKAGATNSVGDGGGIRMSGSGTITLNQSTVSGNIAGSDGGGASISSGRLYVNYSTFSGNQVTNSDFGGGGAIAVQGPAFSPPTSAQVTVTNSTISGNSVVGSSTATFVGGGGIRISTGTFAARNSTITNNSASDTSAAKTNGGGGILITLSNSDSVVILDSTIVAQNHHVVDPDMMATPSMTFNVFLNNSLIGAVTDPSIGMSGSFQAGDFNNPLDAKLTALGNYGGPTQTHALSPNSPAIDMGNNDLGLAFDQRGMGFPRVTGVGMVADVGAFEGLSPIPLAFANLTDVSTAGGMVYTFTVLYADDIGINKGTLGDNDLTITGPGFAMPIPAKFVTSTGTGGSVTATYNFVPPNGTWDGLDNGDYTVTMNANAVGDGTNFVPAGPLGSFRVGIAGNFVVNSKVDENDNDYSAGDFSLREAVRLSNFTIMGASTIGFAPQLQGETLTLTLGQLSVTSDMEINGPTNGNLSISGNNASRIFDINNGAASSSNVSISGLRLINGKIVSGDGGAINVQNENLTLTNVTIADSVATTTSSSTGDGGGINFEGSGGSLMLVASTIRNNVAGLDGGGVNFEGATTVTILRSTIANNTAGDDGGGLLFEKVISPNSHSVLIDSSTISGNQANASFGGGGGINFGGSFLSLVIRNSTISGNATTKDGGGLQFYAVNDATVIQNTTIAFNTAGGNGGGINQHTDATGFIQLQSTIVSNNSAGTGNDMQSTVGSISAQQSALGNFSVANFSDFGGNLLGQNLMLAPLAFNGGLTKTHALAANSPAIDAGFDPMMNLPSDQRGAPAIRTFDDAGVANAPGSDGTDIGSFERQPLALPTVSSVLVNNIVGGQRSMVTSVKVSFSQAVSFPNGIAAAFDLQRYDKGSVGTVGMAFNQVGQDVTITFNNTGTLPLDPNGSLQDGQFKLAILANNISGFGGTMDGNGNLMADGSPADDVVTAFHRLFGDGNGDGAVTAADFNAFRLDYGSPGPSIFDYDGGGVTASDFNAFRLRYGLSNYLP